MAPYKRIFILFFTCITMLTSCNAPIYQQTESNISNADQQIDTAKQKMNGKIFPEPALVVKQEFYVDNTPIPISLVKLPSWLKNRIILRGEQLPFSYYSRTILGGENKNILLQYQPELKQNVQITINYSGTIKGALDLLAAKTGYIYSISGNHVYWQAFVTKTFNIAFMPGSSDYMMGGGMGAVGSGVSSNGTGGTSSGGTTAPPPSAPSSSSGMGADGYSSLKGSISVWKDLEDTIHNLLSPEGKVMVSQATTSVTVRDRPINVNLIAQFIKNLNSNLSTQVLVKIDVIQVNLESDYNYGINWNLVQRAIDGGRYQLVSDNGTPISLSSSVGLDLNSLTSLGIINPGLDPNNMKRDSGTQVLINALKKQGKVSVVTQPQVLCQNNQVSSIELLDQESYLASVQTTNITAGGTTPSNNAAITSQITPGTVTTGFTLLVLPKILGNKVYLQVNADLSNNLGLQTITSNGSKISSGNPPTGTSIIQAPHIQLKRFNQRSLIASGDTMILSGFKQVSNQVGASQLFNSQTLGGKASQQVSSETIIFITPYILRGLV